MQRPIVVDNRRHPLEYVRLLHLLERREPGIREQVISESRTRKLVHMLEKHMLDVVEKACPRDRPPPVDALPA